LVGENPRGVVSIHDKSKKENAGIAKFDEDYVSVWLSYTAIGLQRKYVGKTPSKQMIEHCDE
jgi:hypothetical protein